MSEGHRKDEIQGEIIHVYDGIEEADNDLPKWWLYIFYGSVLFAALYWFTYEEFEVLMDPDEAYTAAMLERAGQGEITEEALAALMGDPDTIAAGQALYASNCVPCHKEQGEGEIGPNLTDRYWIHGGSGVAIHDTIRDGVLTAGMPAWGGPLGPNGVRQVSAFVLTLRNTDVAGKEPQGELWVPGDTEEAAAPETGEEEPEGAEPTSQEEEAPGADAEDEGELGAAPGPATEAALATR